MNNRANIMYFVEQLCDMATKENHLDYVRMIQRDILHIVDAVAPADGSGAANVKHVRRVLQGLQSKSVLSAETVLEIDSSLKERETHPAHLDLEPVEGAEPGSRSRGTPRGSKTNGTLRVDKRQIEQRIEEDRERNKRLRESMWAVSGDDEEENGKFWDDASDTGEDDFLGAEEELIQRGQMVAAQ
jgi:CTD kinase subunit gamma